MLWDSNPTLLPFRQFIRPCKGFNSGTRSRYASQYISTTCYLVLQYSVSSLVTI